MNLEIESIAQSIVNSHKRCHITANLHERVPFPSREIIINNIKLIRELIFPKYFNIRNESLYSIDQVKDTIHKVYNELTRQVILCICFEHRTASLNCAEECVDCQKRADSIVLKLLNELPNLRELLYEDVEVAYEGDPAAQSFDEVILSYPGLQAILIHRIAHNLYCQNVPLIPRIMSEYTHSLTGIDIHPGAEIGRRFFIDHGTGVVIGATTSIGNNVKVYQGVTLGALSFPRINGNLQRDTKRHPTIEDDVIIYSGATILGGDTVIGRGSTIGGNVWLTHSVAPKSKVIIEEPEIRILRRSLQSLN